MSTTRTEYLRGYQDALDGKTANPPPRMEPDLRPRVGATVRILRGDGTFFKKGTKALLCRQDGDGDWWAEFDNLGNPSGSFDPIPNSVWCVGRWPNFEVVE